MTEPVETTKPAAEATKPTVNASGGARKPRRTAESSAAEKLFQDAAATVAAPSTNLEIVSPTGGQIALTAHNDVPAGSWSITRGPGGHVLAEGLTKEQACAIVGAPTDGSEPRNEAEAWAIKERRELEEKSADYEVKTMFQTDEEADADAEAGTENA